MSPLERLKGLETFVAVADAGSFVAAGARLNLTNSAVGKAIGRLEARLARQLFERGGRRLQLTDAGDAFYQVCVRVLDDLEGAERMLSQTQIAPSGRVRVDMPATFGRMHGMPALLDYAAAYPQVVPHVSFTDRFVDPVEDGLDLVLRIGGGDTWPAALGCRHLGNEALVFCAAPAYLARHGAPADLEALFTRAAVLYGRPDGGASPWFIQERGKAPVRRIVEGRIVLGQAEAQVAAVEAGLGIAQLATWVIEQQLSEGRLQVVLPEYAAQGLPLHLVWQRSRRHTPRVRTLIEHFDGALGDRLAPAGIL